MPEVQKERRNLRFYALFVGADEGIWTQDFLDSIREMRDAMPIMDHSTGESDNLLMTSWDLAAVRYGRQEPLLKFLLA